MWQEILINVFCILVALGGLASAAWALWSGEIASEGLDGIFLIAVAMLAALLFAAIPFRALRRAGLRRLLGRLPGRRASHEQQRAHA